MNEIVSKRNMQVKVNVLKDAINKANTMTVE